MRHLWNTGARELRVLVRIKSKAPAVDDLQVERVPGDICEPDSLARALEGVAYVYHCAASTSQWRPLFDAIRRTNVEGTKNILNASLKAGVKRVLYVSTVDTLGISSLKNPADENWPEHDSIARYKNPYADTKYEAELQAKKFLDKGIDLIVVKPTYMIGEWDAKPSSGQMILQIARGRAIAFPGGGNNFVDVLDVCEGLRLAMEKGKSGEDYILANEQGNMSYKDFFTLTAKVAGVNPPKFKIPYAAAVLGGYVNDVAGRLFRFSPDVNSVTAKMGYASHYFSGRKAIHELGMPQSPIEPAVKRAIVWFKKYGYLT